VNECGVASDHRRQEGVETRVREGQTVLQAGDALALGRHHALGRRYRQAAEEWRVPGNLAVIDGRTLRPGSRGRLCRGWSDPCAQSHARDVGLVGRGTGSGKAA
jgi:hypothetical protein